MAAAAAPMGTTRSRTDKFVKLRRAALGLAAPRPPGDGGSPGARERCGLVGGRRGGLRGVVGVV